MFLGGFKMVIKGRFADLRKASLFDKILVSVIVLGLIISSCYYISTLFEEDSKEETLEVYSFLVEGELTLRCVEEVGSNACAIESDPLPTYYTLQVMPDPSKGTVLVAIILELNETEVWTLWGISITGVVANTSRGYIKDQGLESVGFLPTRTLIVVAFFDFLSDPFEYNGLTYSSPTN